MCLIHSIGFFVVEVFPPARGETISHQGESFTLCLNVEIEIVHRKKKQNLIISFIFRFAQTFEQCQRKLLIAIEID